MASKIAAGEVIERPASVVKELLENALDAGGRRLVVELEGGGVELIRVSDDGDGMTADDAPLAFTRHATSKIRDAADLDRIATLGFRGEALPSIAAIAAVELTTRPRGAASGTRVCAEHGSVVDVREAGVPPGTTVAVRGMFAPVPARRKFLKSAATELGHVAELVSRLALAFPHVHFRLLHQGRELATYPQTATLAERARQVFGRDRVQGGRLFAAERLGVGVRGFLFSPHLSFASARHLCVYVNGRSVRDRGLSHAVGEGYASLVPRGRWPGAVVMVSVPSADVDVNVHPAKHEVRFRLAHVVHDTVLTAIRRALATGSGECSAPGSIAEALADYAARPAAPPTLVFAPGVGAPVPGTGARVHGGAVAAGLATGSEGRDQTVDRDGRTGRLTVPDHGDRGDTDHQGSLTQTGGFASLRFVGQVFRGYIVCEGADRLVLIDQHAAHERVAFERLRRQHRAGAIERQTLLIPVPVELDPRQVEATLHADTHLRALGFEIELFGERTVLVRAVPALLGADDPRLLIEDLADALAETGSDLPGTEAVEEILGRMACHSVVRVGRRLGGAEVNTLLADLDALAYASNCPHGRPVSVEFSRAHVERMFGR